MDYDELGAALLRVLFWRCLLPLILMALVWLIMVSREVIKDVIVSLWQGIEYLVTFIWKAHLAVGTAVVTVVRDLMVVKFWQDDYSSRAARVAIVLWLTAVPVVLAFGLLVMAALFWSVVLSGLSAKNNALYLVAVSYGIVQMLPSIVAIVYGYYRYYFCGPLTHHRLVRFVKEYYLMRAEVQLAWLDFETRLMLFWLAPKQHPVKD